ncbi:HEAT repeat domain-containing protein [Plantactinospora sp. WMMC1484]|uniref:HEAT repeat domain-containing protein n=1 Tax=Plantactinospora sp. WMMC1484 TaxID=3404122 RepID=UPI003BF5D47C
MLAIRAQLTASNRAGRVEALDGLLSRASHDDEEARQLLREIVMNYRDFDSEIYGRALNQVWAFGDERLAESLFAALADADYGCQMWAATACGRLGIHAAEPLLIQLLEHPEGLVRESACDALGRIASSAAIDALTRRLDDPAEFVRAAASKALANVGTDDAVDTLWAAFLVRRYRRAGHLASALAQLGPRVCQRLVEATAHEDPEIRYWAARALGATGDDRAEPVLTRLAARDHATTATGAHVSTAAKRGLKTLHRMRDRHPASERTA